MKNSDDIIRWHFGNNVKHDVIEKMNYRAQVERKEFLHESQKGVSFRDIHKEAILRGERYKDIIDSIIQKLNIPVNSVCADLGAGTATFASLMSLQPSVQKVYAVEISEQFITTIMPLTFDYFKADKQKIVRVVGDFNRLEFENDSLDFTVETGSFHHSEDISRTLTECYRVLKPGGFLLSVERARSNIISSFKKKRVLDKELSVEMKKKYGIPEGKSYTRRMWGEHEYTFEEWNCHFKKAGFSTKMVALQPYTIIQPFRFLMKKFFSVGTTCFEPLYLTKKWFFNQPYVYYELLSIPIFICEKPQNQL